MSFHTYRDVGPTIWLSRKTDLITDEQVAQMALACDIQVRDQVAPAWATLPRPVRVLQPGTEAPGGDYILELVDDSAPGTLGYHTELEGDLVSGIIGVAVILGAGSQVLTGNLAVSTVVSHEVCEMVVNPNVSGWSDTGRGWLVATEVCDPVQSNYYEIEGVSVSNFVTPDFFSPVVTEGDKYDHLGVLNAPFQIAKGGYVLNYEAGEINSYYGSVPPPAWLMEMKATSESRSRRLKDHRPQ